MSLELFGFKNLREKINQEKKWKKNNFADCPYIYDPENNWIDNAPICRLSLLETYCDVFGIYQILNKEFNDALAREIKKLELSPVLEVGAGTGELTAAMKNRGIQIHAVDNFETPLPSRASEFKELPEQMDYKKAIDIYKPQLILCSWMPEGEDWSPDFRNADSVQAYILIGEVDGRCGKRETFSEIPGWESYVLKEPNKWSMCRFDHGLDFEKPEMWWRHGQVLIYKRQS